MPRIRGTNIDEHHELAWSALSAATEQLLRERDYESITLGQIATRAGFARNTLYNYAPDKRTLILALAERASRPMLERVEEIATRSQTPALDRLCESIEAILGDCAKPPMRLILVPTISSVITEEAPQGPFSAVMSQVENIVREGIACGEFRGVDDVRLVVELLSGIMRAAAEHLTRDPAAFASTVQTTQQLIVASLH